MEEGKIRSRQNPLVKHARAVRDRKESEQIFIEGLRLSEEALGSRLDIQDALYTERLERDERGVRLLHELRRAGCRLSMVADDVMASISDTRTPQGIVILAAHPRTGPLPEKPNRATSEDGCAEESQRDMIPLIVIIHALNNPSNAGAILRTAEAAGATGIIATKGTTDLFSTKALRGAMGSAFRLPIWTDVDFADAINWCAKRGIPTIGSHLGARKAHTEIDWTLPCALVFGSEAAGLTGEELSMLDEGVLIPMHQPVESLNVAVACGIILYEAYRQRATQGPSG